MAPHSSTPAWKIPWIEEPGRLQSMGSLSWARLRDFTFTFHLHALEKEMASHSGVLAWRIPAVSGVAQSWTRLKRLSSSSSHLGNLFVTYSFKSFPHFLYRIVCLLLDGASLYVLEISSFVFHVCGLHFYSLKSLFLFSGYTSHHVGP